MDNSLNYFVGVSWPRSGHHLIVRVLKQYFGNKFGYCEFYEPQYCCKQAPCVHRGEINLSKNHDYNNFVKKQKYNNYIVQYRQFLPALISNYELHLFDCGDSKSEFVKYAFFQLKKYEIFLKKWANVPRKDVFVCYLAYENLAANPFQELGNLIKLFDPDMDLDEVKLYKIIKDIAFVTTRDKSTAIKKNAGISERRNINSFRYYDEELFEELSHKTDELYLRINRNTENTDNKKPYYYMDQEFNSPIERSIVSADLFVDATGPLTNEKGGATGIPRVEQFIVRCAIDDPDPSIKLVRYDRKFQRYRLLTFNEKQHLKSTRKNDRPKSPRHEAFKQAIELIQENPNRNRHFDRHWAKKITGKSKKHPETILARYVVFFYRIGYRCKLARKSTIGTVGSQIDLSNCPLLMSHIMVFGSFFRPELVYIGKPIVIVHDLIPWTHPELTIGSGQANRFVGQLSEFIRNDASALCTSQTSCQMLHDFIADMGDAEIQFEKFKMPSFLFEIAESLKQKTNFLTRSPYILYCSTIEARKNHILLAKVWKQALEDGLNLPKLVCAGKWGWGVDELEEYLRQNPDLNSHIEFTGYVSDSEMIELYRGAMFGVVPSLIEGWGLCASECLDFGLPVIVSNAPALKEATKGLMPAIDPLDQQKWFDTIHSWSVDPENLKQMRKIILEEYSPTTIEESWKSLKMAIKNYT